VRSPAAARSPLPYASPSLPLSLSPSLPHSLPLFCSQNFAEERGIQFLETSAKNSNNVEKAFLMMAAEIKNRMAMVPAQEEAKDKISVGKGESVKSGGGGGCC
jgi:hypothetical protein